MYQRSMAETIEKRLKEKRRFIQVIVGPRQVGKTTAIQQILKDLYSPSHYASHYAAADLPAPPDTQWISRQWDSARRNFGAAALAAGGGSARGILVLDEVQKIPHWSSEVKRLWDEDTRAERNIHVVILGSSALLIQKGLEESLAGRFELVRFPHWSWTECKKGFNWSLDQYIYFGGYPGSAELIGDEQRWGQYIRDSLIETTLSKDILLLNRVEKPALLRQLFVLACEYGGQILSYQKIIGQLTGAGNTTTIAHYQRLLESAFLISGLPKWSGSTVRRRNSTPKWQPLNTGLCTALANRSFKESKEDPEWRGRLIEMTLGAHLVNEGLLSGIDVFYWRQGNYEVDFVLRKGRKILGIEVKSGRRPRVISGLAEFAHENRGAKTLVVGGSEVSLQKFLEIPLSEWLE